MKKRIASVVLASAMALCLAGCTGTSTTSTTDNTESTSSLEDLFTSAVEDAVNDVVDEVQDTVDEVTEEVTGAVEGEDAEGVMTYAEYAEAALDSEVTIVAYVQDHQSWWDNKISVYAQDQEGGYFIYNLTCSEEDAEKLVPGTKIKVTGFKTMWPEVNGEVEISEGATFEFVEDGDSFIADPVDVTDKIGTEDLANYMNQKVLFTDMTVESIAFKNDEPGDDIYVTLSKDGIEVNFCLEYYLNGDDAEFYEQVGNLEIGSVVDVEAFLYWYEGPNPHITAVEVK